MNLAEALANAVLEGESPRDFLKRLGKVARTIRIDWREWDDLEEWQRKAALELVKDLQAELDDEVEPDVQATDLELDDYDHTWMTVSQGRAEYMVYEDSDVAEAVAIRQVRDSMQQEPENFSSDFLSNYIDTDQLRRNLHSDEANSAQESFDDEYSDYEAKRDFLIDHDLLDRDIFYTVQKDEEGDDVEVEVPLDDLERTIDSAVEDYIEATVTERLSDPVAYLADIYGKKEGMEVAMRIGGVDYETAAREAVHSDGAAHYLSGYDGHEHELACGAVYYRVN